MTPNNLPALPEIDELTREIHVLESHAAQRAHSAIELKIEIGKRLMRAKELLPHGKFLPWAEKEFGWSRVWVAKHMELGRNVNCGLHLPPAAGIRAVLAAVAEAKSAEEPAGDPAPAPGRLHFVITYRGESLELAFREDSAQAAFLLRATEAGKGKVGLERAA